MIWEDKMQITERKKNVGPTDSVKSLNIDTTSMNETINFESCIKFDTLPIAGWNDNGKPIDSKCKQSCVSDCSCVSHCSWIVA